MWTKGAVDLLTRIQHSIWCLDPKEGLSPRQAQEIGRVMRLYPKLGDDSFVATNREPQCQVTPYAAMHQLP